MAIFISYSHQDKEFVDRLAVRLTEERVHVWLDRVELRIGDSLTQRIEAALQSASAVLVVLSSAFVESDWCRRELTAGLVRELEEHRVLVLPLFIQDCQVPLFLRDKLRADFRLEFEQGFADLTRALAPFANPHRGRLEGQSFLTDYAIDYFDGADYFNRRITIVEHGSHLPCITITELHITGDRQATASHKDYADVGLEWWSDLLIVELLASSIPELKMEFDGDDPLPKSQGIEIRDAKLNARYQVVITSRLLGSDIGSPILVHVGNQLRQVFDDQRRATRALTESEKAKIAALRSRRGA
jgi:hypothetical protein